MSLLRSFLARRSVQLNRGGCLRRDVVFFKSRDTGGLQHGRCLRPPCQPVFLSGEWHRIHRSRCDHAGGTRIDVDALGMSASRNLFGYEIINDGASSRLLSIDTATAQATAVGSALTGRNVRGAVIWPPLWNRSPFRSPVRWSCLALASPVWASRGASEPPDAKSGERPSGGPSRPPFSFAQ